MKHVSSNILLYQVLQNYSVQFKVDFLI